MRSKNFVTVSLLELLEYKQHFIQMFFICLHTKFHTSGPNSWSKSFAKAQAATPFISKNFVCINRSDEWEDVENDELRSSCHDERQPG